MSMIIKNLVINENEKETVCIAFSSRLTIIENSPIIYDVIKILLGCWVDVFYVKNLRFEAHVEIDKLYKVFGKKDIKDKSWTISVVSQNGEDSKDEYFSLVHSSREADNLHFFHHFKRLGYPYRLAEYKDSHKYYPNGEFKSITDGYGCTRAFRTFTGEYIRSFLPLRLRKNKDMFLYLSSDGMFKVCDKSGEEVTALSESENLLYRYMCFLNLAEFWSRAEKIRNLNRIKKPLVISSFLDRLDSSIEISEILDKTKELPRQTIMLAPRRR